MLSCKEVSALQSAAQENPLRWRERIELRMHLMICKGCRHFGDHMDFMRQAMRQYARQDTVRSAAPETTHKHTD